MNRIRDSHSRNFEERAVLVGCGVVAGTEEVESRRIEKRGQETLAEK